MSTPPIAPIMVLEHIGCEPPAAYGEVLAERGIQTRTVRLHAGEIVADWRAHSAIIAMGGPMGTYDEAIHPWLAAEKAMIAQAVRAGLPFWGVCLGAQLLAASLGASVAPGPWPEVGVLPVQLTAQAASDPVFAGAPRSFSALQWHGDTYELPAGARQLARSRDYEQQAFVFGRAYALQFHLEVDAALVTGWGDVPAYADSLSELPGEDPMSDLIDQVGGAERESLQLARALFSRWLDLVVPGGPSPGGS